VPLSFSNKLGDNEYLTVEALYLQTFFKNLFCLWNLIWALSLDSPVTILGYKWILPSTSKRGEFAFEVEQLIKIKNTVGGCFFHGSAIDEVKGVETLGI